MKKSILLLAVCLCACSKQDSILQSETEHCSPVWLVSEKYTKGNVYIRTDTLWKDASVCGRALDSCMAAKQEWYVMCADLSIEHWYYIIGKNAKENH